jgi:hypothetical protein
LEEPAEPLEEPAAPLEETSTPLEETTAPLEEPAEPLEEPAEPLEETSTPLEETTVPLEEPAVPLEETTVPLEEPASPSQEPSTPLEEPAAPLEEHVEPFNNLVQETVNILFTHISEGKNIDLNKWICHHLGLGFSHIYILNIGNRLSKNIYYSSDLVTIINTDKHTSLESVMRQSYNFSHKYMFDWMLYIRYNEFLHLSRNLREFLNDKVKFDQIIISNRSILNIHSINVPNSYSNYYFTFSDMSNSYINNDLRNYIS